MSTIRQEPNKNDDRFETIQNILNYLFIFSLYQHRAIEMIEKYNILLSYSNTFKFLESKCY